MILATKTTWLWMGKPLLSTLYALLCYKKVTVLLMPILLNVNVNVTHFHNKRPMLSLSPGGQPLYFPALAQAAKYLNEELPFLSEKECMNEENVIGLLEYLTS